VNDSQASGLRAEVNHLMKDILEKVENCKIIQYDKFKEVLRKGPLKFIRCEKKREFRNLKNTNDKVQTQAFLKWYTRKLAEKIDESFCNLMQAASLEIGFEEMTLEELKECLEDFADICDQRIEFYLRQYGALLKVKKARNKSLSNILYMMRSDLKKERLNRSFDYHRMLKI